MKMDWKPVRTYEELKKIHDFVDNEYKLYGPIQGTWHPLLQLSCLMKTAAYNGYDLTPDLLDLLIAFLKFRDEMDLPIDPRVIKFMEKVNALNEK